LLDAPHGEHEALQRLCAHFGIATDYHDIFGNRHVIAPANLVTLLASFGVDPHALPHESLEQVDAAHWQGTLPPAVAVDAGREQWQLTLRLPAAQPEIGWTLHTEDGTPHHGRIDLHALPEGARGERDGVVVCERRVTLNLALPIGYHRLSLDGYVGETLVLAAPPHCYQPPALRGDGRVWGPAVAP